MGTYCRGTEKDTDAILDFADMVFSMASGSTDFEQILPKAYSPARRNTIMHHMIREESGIRALIDVYPETLSIGSEKLQAGYIGTVSVHPKARSKGYMIELMEKVEASLRAEGYDLMILDGNRHRYQHYGFEKAGIKYCFNVTGDSIRHFCNAAAKRQSGNRSGMDRIQDISFRAIESAQDELLDTVYELYQKRHVTIRDREALYLTLMSWGADVFAVIENDTCVGYLNTSADGNSIYELGLADRNILPAVIYAYMTEMDVDELGINVGMDETDKLPLLDGISDYYAVSMSHQIKILQYERVLYFLFLWKKQYAHLEDGCLVVGIKEENTEKRYEIKVANETITVKETTRRADMLFDRLSFVKILTTSYYFVALQQTDSPLADAPKGWFPLPFFLPEADAF